MDIPGDIDLTEARDFQEGGLIIGKPKHLPSKVLPWEKDEVEYYINGNTVSITNSGRFPFTLTNNILTSSNTKIPDPNTFRFAFTNERNNSSTTILYKITNERDLYIANSLDTNICVTYEKEFMKRRIPTDREMELEAWYTEMPFSRDVFRYTFISEELSSSEQFIVPVVSCIEDLTRYQIEMESIMDEISSITFEDLLTTKENDNSVWVRLHERLVDELQKDNPYDKIIPWE